MPPLEAQFAPCPRSSVIEKIAWSWDTLRTAAPGSDLWPVTWAGDDTIFTAWGDGGGFGGTDREGRVALGFGRIEGAPDNFKGFNINGGKSPEHPASFPKKGKVGGLLAVRGRVYGWLNTQDGTWPDVDDALIWSDDKGLTWQQAKWVFPKGAGSLKPSTFLNFGKDYTGVPPELTGYIYFYGQKQNQRENSYLGRAPIDRFTDHTAFEYLETAGDVPSWTPDIAKARPVFGGKIPCGDLAGVAYVPALKRYLLTTFHSGPGELGVFDAAHPWGPWTTVAYEDHWGGMGHGGEGLTCSFPSKWMSDDGLTLWCVFSVYGGTAKEGINAHDKFNLVKATLQLKR